MAFLIRTMVKIAAAFGVSEIVPQFVDRMWSASAFGQMDSGLCTIATIFAALLSFKYTRIAFLSITMYNKIQIKGVMFVRDGCGRLIRYLRLSVTDLCNFRCQYCMPPEGVHKRCHGDILSVEECVEVVRAAAACGVNKVRLTGGEPLVRRGIVDICAGISEIPEIQELCITTNGSLLPRLAGDLRRAGVTRLNISLDTLNKEKFHAITRVGTEHDVLDGIRAAQEAGFTDLKLNTVLLGGWNDDEIPDLVALTKDNPWQVRFIELMPMGICADWPRERFLPASVVPERCPDLQPIGEGAVTTEYRVPGWVGTVGLITPLSHRFCSRCDRIRITSDGRLKPCLHSDQEIPLRGLHGQALIEAIEAGIAAKPQHHQLESGRTGTHRDMNQIGG